MTKTEIKKNITKINKLIKSEYPDAGIELIKALKNKEVSEGTGKTIELNNQKEIFEYVDDVISRDHLWKKIK